MWEVRDCSPFIPQPTGDEATWLRRLQQSVDAAHHVVALGPDRAEHEPIVYCERDGTWWTGRYVGSLTFEGRRLTILPRFGLDTLRHWLGAVTHLALVTSHGQLREDASFIVQLLAMIWGRAFVEAARHGLPALRRDRRYSGTVVRGRIDLAATIRLRAAGHERIVSVRRERSLDHAASRAIVAAYDVLQRWMGGHGSTSWLPERAQDLLPHLQAVTGPRPPVPTSLELQDIRYTPITQSFRGVAELSRRIAHRRGLFADSSPEGTSQGVLLDVAELWELYVLAALRRAAPSLEVRHGTRERSTNDWLLRDGRRQLGMGLLKPDALIVYQGRVIGLVDAKYKSLKPTSVSPYGPQREDLYQLAAYMSRFADAKTWGMLIYPHEPDATVETPAEARGPWSLAGGNAVSFVTLPHTLSAAVAKLDQTWVAAPDPV